MTEPARFDRDLDGRLTVVETGAGLGDDFAADVRRGLFSSYKKLSCRFLYDDNGSALFEQICALPEYYLTRAERAILAAHADEIAACVPHGAALVELGSGSAQKTRILIEAMLLRTGRLRYVPIDISRAMLHESARRLLADYEALEVHAIAAEYRAGLGLLHRDRAQPKLVAWLGSNIGNFGRREAGRFLRDVGATLGPADRLLVGVDLRKPRALLEAAYDDAAGVTAQFNLNLLRRINAELGGRFDLDAFAHRARWNERLGRVEMHLVSKRDQLVRIDALDATVVFRAGETIFTESSYKYAPLEIDRLARGAGFVVERRWLDRGRRFSVNLLALESA